MSGHKPLEPQNTPWVGVPQWTQDFGDGISVHGFRRHVADGTLIALVGKEPILAKGEIGWHISVSFRDQTGQYSRYPSWDEQVHAVRELLPKGLTYHMILPPDDEGYVSLHDTTFHWHEYREGT